MLRLVGITVVLAVIGAATLGFARSGNPPDARTGAPGESTCAGCHGNLNVGDGSIIVTAPDSFAPGDTVDITVQVEDPGQTRWGFELTVLDDANAPVGDIIVIDPARTQLSGSGGGRRYLKQTGAGTDWGVPNISPGWSFRWASPVPTPEVVTFYIAGLAANGNGSTGGDYTYTEAHVYEDVGAFIEDEITWGKIKALFR